MSNESVYLIVVILVASACCFTTRALPFALFSGKNELPSFAKYLGRCLPSCVMAVLVIYCLKGVTFASLAGFAPALISVAVVILLQLWKRNNLISIAGGTILYMVLVQVVFK